MQPAFTIFIPTYNGEAYIKPCIESVLNQDYPHYNVVVLDSGSSDGTLDIIASYAYKASIEIVQTNSRLGIVENWSRILPHSKREWMTVLGQDDVLHSSFLSEMALLIEQNPQTVLFFSHFLLIDEMGTERRPCLPMPMQEGAADFVKARFLLERDSFATGYVLKSSEYERVGGIPPYPDLLFSDDALWVELTMQRPMVISPKHLFSYRLHTGSTSGLPHQDRLTGSAKLYLEALYEKSKALPTLKNVIHKHGPHQFAPVLVGYLGLASLYYSAADLDIPPYSIQKVNNLCQLLGLDEKQIRNHWKCFFLVKLNQMPFRKQLAHLIFQLVPSLKSKAKFEVI